MPRLIRQQPAEPFALTLQIFLLRANGKTRSFVFLLSPGPQIFFWSLDACGDSGVIGILDFPFTRIAALIWSKTQTRGNSAEKLGNDSRNKQKDKHIKCSHRHSNDTSLCNIRRRRFIGSNWRLTTQPVKFTAGQESPVVLNPPPAPAFCFSMSLWYSYKVHVDLNLSGKLFYTHYVISDVRGLRIKTTVAWGDGKCCLHC